MGATQRFYTISQENIDYIIEAAAKAGAKAGIEAHKKAEEKQKEKADRVMVAKVRKILETYRALKNDLSHSDYETEDAQKELRFKCVEDLMNPGETHMDDVMAKEVERLKRNAWSKRQIERAIELLKEDCQKEGAPEAMRRYRVIIALYIQDEKMSYEEIAEQENIVERTVYKDVAEACRILAPYLLNLDKIPGIA